MRQSQPKILIAGAGPSGLSAALFLSQQGIAVTVIEQGSTPSTDPRAATFHPPTLEMLAPSGVTDALIARGIIGAEWQSRDRHEGLIASFDLSLLAGDTPFPYRLQCEQHKFVQILTEKMAQNPLVELKFNTKILGVTQTEEGVTCETDQGPIQADWLIGADGGRSIVRKSQDIAFEGFTYPERFLVITTSYDFAAQGFAVSNYVADPKEWCAVFQVPGERKGGVWRSVFPLHADADEAQILSDVSGAHERVSRFVPTNDPFEVLHINVYHVHQRVAATYRKGRVLLIGDAAHINNPLGGMGMNFGVHDAHNLAEKISQMLLHNGDDDLLNLFDRQRRFAATTYLQAMSIQNKRNLEETDEAARQANAQALREKAADPAASRAHLMQTSMIAGLRAASAIT
jgi:3-(3-hydroxy-phenyl)propionate hydroxylase